MNRTLVSIRPRNRRTGWTVNGTYGNVYQTPWTELVVGVYGNSLDSADEASDLADCAATDYSWFHSNGVLYFNPPSFGSGNPNNDVTVIEWDMLLSTDHLNWYREPKTLASGEAIWEGGLIKPPVPTQGYTDLLFGFSPIQITSIQAQVADGKWLERLHDVTFLGSRVKVWECDGELSFSNISEKFIGAGKNYSIRDGVLTVQVVDPLSLLDEQIEGSYFDTTTFPNLDPQADGHSIRKLYGFVSDMVPTNIDYAATPSTTDNRNWVVCEGPFVDQANLSRLINHLSPNNTATTTQLFDASGFLPSSVFFSGDKIVIKDGGVDKYATVTAVNYGTNVITHTSIGARAPVVTDFVSRGFVGSISITDGPTTYFPLYGRDYTAVGFLGNTAGFILLNNFEAALGMPTFDPSTMVISCRAYGNAVLPKRLDNVTDFGALSDQGGTFSNPVVILWDILRNQINNFERVVPLDETGWLDLADDFDRPVGILIPDEATQDFPSWKEVIQRLLQTEILKLHYKQSAGLVSLTITQTGSSGAAVGTASQDEFREAEFDYNFDDLYYQVTLTLATRGNFNTPLLLAQYQSNIARFLHRVFSKFSMDCLFQYQSDAQIVAQRILAILNDRRGTVSLILPQDFSTTKIDDTVTVSSDHLPGFVKSVSINSRDYVVIQHSKAPNGIGLLLDDQKGINDFGGW